MRTGDVVAVGLVGCVAAGILATTGLPGDRFLVEGYTRSSLLLPVRDAAAWSALLLALAVLLAPRLPRDLASRAGRLLERPSPRTFALLVFAWVAAAGILVQESVLKGGPNDIDDPARILQARTYADGRLLLPEPPESWAFSVYSVLDNEETRYGKYEPAPSMVMALSLLLTGREGLLNPLLGGLMVACLYLGLREAGAPERRSRFAALLLCGSPFVVFMGASLFSHPLCAAALAAAFWATQRAGRTGGAGWLALAGVALSVALASRPWSAALVGSVLAGFAVLRGGAKGAPRRLAALAAGALPGILLWLAYNAALTGDPLLTPFHQYAPDELPWFGYRGHTPAKGVENTLGLLRILDLNLLGWPSALVFLPLLAAGRRSRLDLLAGSCVLALVLGMFPYFWTDSCFGARFYYSAAPFLAWLMVGALCHLDDLLEVLHLGRTGHRAALAAVLLLTSWSTLFYLPPLVRLFADDYGKLGRFPTAALVEALSSEPTLVLLSPSEHENEGYTSAFLANPADLQAVSRRDHARVAAGGGSKGPGGGEGLVLFARDAGPSYDVLLEEAYPGRRILRMPHPVLAGALVVRDAAGQEVLHLELPPR